MRVIYRTKIHNLAAHRARSGTSRNTGTYEIETPSFFRFGEYKRYLARNDNVLILPQSRSSNCLLWQAKTRFYFRIAAVRIGPVAPAEFLRWPVLSTFDSGDEIMDFPEQLNAFLGAHQVKAIIVDPGDHGPWARLISESGFSPLEIGGVLFYKVPPTVLASFRTATAHQMAEKEAAISFAALVSAAIGIWMRAFRSRSLILGSATVEVARAASE